LDVVLVVPPHEDDWFDTQKELDVAQQHLKDHPDSKAYRRDVDEAKKAARDAGHRV